MSSAETPHLEKFYNPQLLVQLTSTTQKLSHSLQSHSLATSRWRSSISSRSLSSLSSLLVRSFSVANQRVATMRVTQPLQRTTALATRTLATASATPGSLTTHRLRLLKPLPALNTWLPSPRPLSAPVSRLFGVSQRTPPPHAQRLSLRPPLLQLLPVTKAGSRFFAARRPMLHRRLQSRVFHCPTATSPRAVPTTRPLSRARALASAMKVKLTPLTPRLAFPAPAQPN